MKKAIELWKHPTGTFLAISALLVLILLGLSWWIVYWTGGTQFSFLHLMYVPIIFASFIFDVKGGLISAVLAGTLLGPLMPLDVENNISQTLYSYIYRTIFFLIVAGIVGYISSKLKLHLLRVQETLRKTSIVYANTLKNYALMVSERDEAVSHHCERVAYNAAIVGQSMGLSEKNLEALYWAGLLHDVGKIGVKENILLKPDVLSTEEFAEIKKHARIGYQLITSLSQDFKIIAEGIRAHHEKWDGSGYPDGLKGISIPLFGRILSVVDVFEALTSERPYKKAWETEKALRYIIEQKGHHFDPQIVDAFIKLFDEGKIWIANKQIRLNTNIIPNEFSEELINYDKIK